MRAAASFTLTYDGMDYEMNYHYSTYDGCTDVGDGWSEVNSRLGQ